MTPGGEYLGQSLLGMCRWPPRAPTPPVTFYLCIYLTLNEDPPLLLPSPPLHMYTHINFMLHVCGCKYEPFHFSKDLYWLNEVLECSITRLKLQSNAHSVQMTLYPCQLART